MLFYMYTNEGGGEWIKCTNSFMITGKDTIENEEYRITRNKDNTWDVADKETGKRLGRVSNSTRVRLCREIPKDELIEGRLMRITEVIPQADCRKIYDFLKRKNLTVQIRKPHYRKDSGHYVVRPLMAHLKSFELTSRETKDKIVKEYKQKENKK